MNNTKIKKAGILCIVLAFFFFILSFVCLYLTKNVPLPKPNKTSIAVFSSGREVITDEIFSALSEHDTELLFDNKTENSISFAVLFDKDAVFDGRKVNAFETIDFSLEKNEAKSVKTEFSSETKIALLLASGTNFVFDDDSFCAAQKFSDHPNDFVLLSGKYDLINIKKPLRLFGDFTICAIEAETDDAGKIVIAPDEEFQCEMFFYSPNCELRFYNIDSGCPEEKNDFSFTAMSYNGKKLNRSNYPIYSSEDMRFLSEHRLFETANIVIKAPINIDEKITFSRNVNLDLQESITFGDGMIEISDNEAGRINVNTSGQNTLPLSKLYIDSPNSSLFWTGDNIPLFENVSKNENVRSFRNKETHLGGRGKGEVKLSIFAEDNFFLEEDVEFVKYRNTYEGYFDFLFNPNQMTSAVFKIDAGNYEAYFENTNTDGSVDLSKETVLVVRDENGCETRSAIEIKRRELDLPVIYLTTENGAEITSKSVYTDGTVAVSYGGEFEDIETSHIRIRGRGNSTWKWDKKPYKLHFDKPVSLFGLPEAEEWALLANYADKSLMRNRVALEMAKELSFDYVPSQFLVDVFLNGEYQGVYTFGEHLEEGPGRVEIKSEPGKNDCGFFLEIGGAETGVDVKGLNYFHAGLVKFVLIKSPVYKNMTSGQFNYIKDYVTKLNDAITKGGNYEDYIDVDSLIDWLIMIELTNNTDCSYRRSTFLIKNSGEKLKMGTVWDFDLALGNFSHDSSDYRSWASSTPGDDYVGTTWTTYLLENEEFKQKFKLRFLEVKEKLVDRAIQTIDETYKISSRSAEKNFVRWDILGKKVAFERKDNSYYKTYDSQIMYLKDFIKSRAKWMEEQVNQW